MIITENLTENVITSGGFKEKSFKIKDPKVIFDILSSKIYNNKIGAIVREIISNAIDANYESKTNRKVDIHLPVVGAEYFTVRDYGIGINGSRINVFVSFGDSTKRDDPNAIGYYGMGSKSPFSYSDSFYITTWYDGFKHEYMAYIDDNKDRKLAVLNKVQSDEPSGSEIRINMKSVSDKQFFISEFKNIWGYSLHLFNPNIIINSEYIRSPLDSLHSRKDISIGYLSSNKNIMILMNGNVAYDFSMEEYRKMFQYLEGETMLPGELFGYPLIAKFKVGELRLAVNREYIEVCKHNAEIIHKKFKGLVDEIRETFIRRHYNEHNFIKVRYKYERFSNHFRFIKSSYIYHGDVKIFKLFNFDFTVTKIRNVDFLTEKDCVLYHLKHQTYLLKDRIQAFMIKNKLYSVKLIKFDYEWDLEKFKKDHPNCRIIPVDGTNVPVRERKQAERKTEEKKKELFDLAITQNKIKQTSGMQEGGTFLDLNYYTQSCYYILTTFDAVAFTPLPIDDQLIAQIFTKHPEFHFCMITKSTMPIFRVASSVKNLIPKCWVCLDYSLFKSVIDSYQVSNYVLRHILEKYLLKIKRSIRLNITQDLPDHIIANILNVLLPKNKNDRFINNDSETFIYHLIRQKSTRKLLANLVRKIKKEATYIVDNFSDIFLPCTGRLKNKHILASKRVSAYIEQLSF